MLFQASVQSMTKLLPALGNYIKIKYMYLTIMKKKTNSLTISPFFLKEKLTIFPLKIIFKKFFNFILILKYR